TPASQLPERSAQPAPGSRRALRAARENGDSQHPTRDETTAAAPAVARDGDGNQLDDLFAPERHHSVPPKRRGRGCLIGLIIVLVLLGGIAVGGAWVYNTYQTKIDDLMGWGEPKDYEAGQATGEALVTIKKGDTGSPVSTALFKAGVTKTDRVFYDYLVDENSATTFYP